MGVRNGGLISQWPAIEGDQTGAKIPEWPIRGVPWEEGKAMRGVDRLWLTPKEAALHTGHSSDISERRRTVIEDELLCGITKVRDIY